MTQDLKEKLEKIILLCKELNISISHEDNQGAFIIEEYSENNADWLRDAFDREELEAEEIESEE